MSKIDYIENLTKKLQSEANNSLFINTSQLAKSFGIGYESAARLLFKLKYIPNGRKKLFLITDVATHVYSQLRCDWIGGAFK